VWFNTLQWLLNLMGIHELLPSSELLSLVVQVMCNDQAITVDICADVLFITIGFDYEQLNKVSVKFQCLLRKLQIQLADTEMI
jgi:lysosomal acid lipase/cholesteryl ester hydrolase